MPHPLNRTGASPNRRIVALALIGATVTLSTLSGCGGGSGGTQTASPTPAPGTPPPSTNPPRAEAYQIQLDQVSQTPVQSSQFSGQIEAQTPSNQTASSSNYQITLNPVE